MTEDLEKQVSNLEKKISSMEEQINFGQRLAEAARERNRRDMRRERAWATFWSYATAVVIFLAMFVICSILANLARAL